MTQTTPVLDVPAILRAAGIPDYLIDFVLSHDTLQASIGDDSNQVLLTLATEEHITNLTLMYSLGDDVLCEASIFLDSIAASWTVAGTQVSQLQFLETFRTGLAMLSLEHEWSIASPDPLPIPSTNERP